MSEWLALLHFQRPQWLWALLLLPLPWIVWRLRRRQDWRGVVDPHLLQVLLVPGRGAAWLRPAGICLALLLAVLALAGPGWRQAAQPQWQAHEPLVVALDLSASIAAPDLPPSRLAQARGKLARLFAQRQGGDLALVAWADDAYTVAPLTADADNVALFLEALAPEVMPVDGHRVDRAITHAAGLLRQAGFGRGRILLLVADAEVDALPIAAATAAAGYPVSVLGLGTPAGAAYRDAQGYMRQTRRNDAALRALAAAGQGRYASLAVDDSDLAALGVLQPADAGTPGPGAGRRMWLDQGYWLLLPLLLLAALAFRRGAALLVLPLALWLLPPLPALARDSPWLRADQLAQQQLEAGVEAYRRGDFEAAAEAFGAAAAGGAQAQYNLGNALARQGRYDEALAAYDRALAQAPDLQDAIANRKVVEAARRRQPPDAGEGEGGRQDRSGGTGRDPPPAAAADAGGSDGEAGRNGKPGKPRAPQDAPPPDSSDGQDGTARSPHPPPAADDPAARERQAQADRAQRERMRQAMRQPGQPGAETGDNAQATPGDAREQERRQAHEAWLRRVPDDPGGLLRAKFQLEHQRRQQEGR